MSASLCITIAAAVGTSKPRIFSSKDGAVLVAKYCPCSVNYQVREHFVNENFMARQRIENYIPEQIEQIEQIEEFLDYFLDCLYC